MRTETCIQFQSDFFLQMKETQCLAMLAEKNMEKEFLFSSLILLYILPTYLLYFYFCFFLYIIFFLFFLFWGVLLFLFTVIAFSVS